MHPSRLFVITLGALTLGAPAARPAPAKAEG
jgi:hypothetical protein